MRIIAAEIGAMYGPCVFWRGNFRIMRQPGFRAAFAPDKHVRHDPVSLVLSIG